MTGGTPSAQSSGEPKAATQKSDAYRAGDGAASSGGTAPADAQQFAEDLFSTCMQTGGDMDNMLGRRS